MKVVSKVSPAYCSLPFLVRLNIARVEKIKVPITPTSPIRTFNIPVANNIIMQNMGCNRAAKVHSALQSPCNNIRQSNKVFLYLKESMASQLF